MTTIEREITTRIPMASPPVERAVFVTDADHRSRRLGMSVRVAGGLALLWAVGLSIGMLGSGHLPGISIPNPIGGDDRPDAGRPTDAQRPTQVLVADRAATNAGAQTRIRPVGSERASSGSVAGGRTTGRTKLRTVAPRRSAPSAPPGQAVGAPTAASPQPVRRGLVRRGLTAPPGQEQKAAQAQLARTPPGQTRRSDHSQTTAPATPTEPLPPGQQKPDKPPPPPTG